MCAQLTGVSKRPAINQMLLDCDIDTRSFFFWDSRKTDRLLVRVWQQCQTAARSFYLDRSLPTLATAVSIRLGPSKH